VADVAVAVVSYQTREHLRACLASLRGDHDAGRAEVWVVDNGSTDGSADMVHDEFGWVTLVQADENLGYGAAVNVVADHTDTPWLVAANADTVVQRSALAALLRAGRKDPRAGAVAPRLLLPDGSTEHSVHPFPTVAFTAAFALGLTRPVADRLCLEGAWNAERSRRVPWAVGAFLLIRREAWDQVGGFDERQWLFAEDLDLGWRLAQAGWQTRYEPTAIVEHHESAATTAAFGPSRTERTQQATYEWLHRRRGRAVARSVAALNVFGALARRDRRWAGIHYRTGLRTTERD
jgi:N-acetylglucosaminyl-diphospho-decaprenol L-rhamnosyltransferase